MTRPEIDWFAALEAAEFYATTDYAHLTWIHGGLRNLALAYLDLLKENGDLRIALEDAKGVAP